MLKRVFCLFFSMALIMNFCSVNAFSFDSNEDPSETIDEEIYYSDLFYRYSYYLKNPFLDSSLVEINQTTTQILNDYTQTPDFKLAASLEGIDSILGLEDIVKTLTDSIGLTSFKYNEELDAANIEFVKQLTSVTTQSEALNDIQKNTIIFKRVDDFLKIFKEIDGDRILSELKIEDLQVLDNYETVTNMWFEYYRRYFKEIAPQMPSISERLYPMISTIGDSAFLALKANEFFEALTLALMVQDVNMELIDLIIKTQPEDSTLHKGMSRLYNQLQNGWLSYFLDTFLRDETISVLCDMASDIVTSLAAVPLSLKIISPVFDLVNGIVFKGILGIDYSKYTEACFLRAYALDMINTLEAYPTTFCKPFSVENVTTYQTLYEAYLALGNAAYDACEILAEKINTDTLNALKNKRAELFKYSFNNYIEQTKKYIRETPTDKREITDFGDWTITESVSLTHGSDVLEEGYIYCPVQGLKTNISLYGWNTSGIEVTIPEDADITIDGSIVKSYPAFLVNNGKLHITGDFKNTYNDRTTLYTTQNNGTLQIDGNMNVGEKYDKVAFIQNKPDASLIVGGNISFYSADECQITDGIVILNGTTQQILNNMSVKDLEVLNPTGIRYDSNLVVSGKYALNGYPLDNGKFQTIVKDDIVFDAISDYKSVSITQNLSLTSSFKGDLHIYGWNTSGIEVTIPEDADITIDGSIVKSYPAFLVNNGKLHITGDYTNTFNDRKTLYTTQNNGTLQIDGDINIGQQYDKVSFIQNKPDASLIVGGNISFYSVDECQITDGTIVFNGSNKQSISNFNAPIIVLDNQSEEGTVFSTRIQPSVLFNHNGNVFSVPITSIFNDYDLDGMNDNEDPDPIHSELLYDLNQDGEQSIADTVLLCRIISEDMTISYEQMDTSKLDFNEDGLVTILDVAVFLRTFM